MKDLQSRFMGLYQQLQFASRIVYADGKLKIRFPATEGFHASLVEASDNRKRLSEAFANIVGQSAVIDVSIDRNSVTAELEEAPDPTEDPRVKSFITRFPGKLIVKKQVED
jgi:hypothetical protein